MEQGGAIIRLRLDVREEPIELGEFVSTFTALAAEFERYKREKHPDFLAESALFVKEVRKGSIEADILSAISVAIPTAVAVMENANTVTGFIEYYGPRLMSLIKPGARLENTSKSELKHFSEQVAAIASIPNSRLDLAAYIKKDGELEERVLFQFKTPEAIQIQENATTQIKEIEQKEFEPQNRVSMVFQRTDTLSADPGKRSGDLVIIKSISSKRLNLIYGSDLTEQAIKNEIRDADDNVYKKVFIVDVYVESMGSKPYAYRVTNLHQVITLEDD